MEDTASFKEMLRMDYDTFLNLLTVIEPYISPQKSNHGQATSHIQTFESSKVGQMLYNMLKVCANRQT